MQAVQCSLADMDGYSEVDLGFEILQTCGLLIGKTLIAEVKNNNGNFSITLYDTSGEDDVNLNRQLKHCFVAYYTKCTPQLPKVSYLNVSFVLAFFTICLTKYQLMSLKIIKYYHYN